MAWVAVAGVGPLGGAPSNVPTETLYEASYQYVLDTGTARKHAPACSPLPAPRPDRILVPQEQGQQQQLPLSDRHNEIHTILFIILIVVTRHTLP